MAILVPFIWGTGFVVAKGAISEFPPILLMAFRFLVTSSVLVWFVKPPIGNLRALFQIAIVASAIQYSLTFSGLKGLDAGFAALIVQLEVPFLVILGVILLGEKPSFKKWIGILIAFFGVGLLVGKVEFGNAWLSVLLVVLGAFTWAIGQILIRQLKKIDGLTTTAWVAVFATPQLFVMSFLFEKNQVNLILNANMSVWWAVLYLGLVMTALGYYFWYTLIRTYQVEKVAPFLLLLPVFSLVGGVIFLGEALSFMKVIGGLVVILGVAFVSIEKRS
ncbi:MAG: DMT family transporter [Paracoccaceae bacterium]